MTKRTRYVLIRAPNGDVHVVLGQKWERDGTVPRARCGARVGDRWVTVASTSWPWQVQDTDCCERCKPKWMPIHPMSSVKPSPVRRAA